MRHVLLFKTCIIPEKFFEFVWIPTAHSSVDRQNLMKNFNSVDIRWVVGTTFNIWEMSGGEEVFWVGLKMADRDTQVSGQS